jgi:hypothetical protein
VGLQNEVKLLLELLPKYVAHVEKHPHTLLVKFFGLYRVLPENGSKVGAGFVPSSQAPESERPMPCADNASFTDVRLEHTLLHAPLSRYSVHQAAKLPE